MHHRIMLVCCPTENHIFVIVGCRHKKSQSTHETKTHSLRLNIEALLLQTLHQFVFSPR